MSRLISFIPSTSAPDPPELTYTEQTSRHRSIHVFLQDTGLSRTASRERFLRNAYRQIVSRYMTMGKIEHPVVLLRGIIAFLDALSARVDSRVTEFDGLFVYVLVQDGNTCYLLASRASGAHLHRAGRFVALGSNDVPGVRELSVESVASQHELFSQSIPDAICLYRIEFEEDDGLAVILGGSADEARAVSEMLSSPAGVGASDPSRVPVSELRQPVFYVHIPRAAPTRLAPLPRSGRRRVRVSRLGGSAVALVSAVLIVGSLGAVWVAQWVRHQAAGGGGAVERGGGAASEAAGRIKSSQAPGAKEMVAPVAAGVETSVSAQPDPGPVTFSLSWKKAYEKPVTSSPALAGDVVYFGGRDGSLYALDRMDGSLEWRRELGAGIGSSPLQVGDRVIACDYGGDVTALDRRTGAPVWKRTLPGKIVSTPAAAGGELVVGCMNGTAYCLSAETGRILWKLPTRGAVRASIAADESHFYVPSYDGTLYALRRGTGGVEWRYQTDGRVSSSPAVGRGGVVVGTVGGEVVMLDAATGQPRWRFRARYAISSFVRVHEDRVYVGTDRGEFHCLDAGSGEPQWDFKAKAGVFGRPHVSGSRVFIGSYDRFVYCLDARTGEELTRFDSGGAVYSSPAGAGNVIYFGNNEGRFYCLRLEGKSAS